MMNDGVSIVRAAALAHAALLDLVPGVRIASGTLPRGTPLPYVWLESVSKVYRKTLSFAGKRHVTERVQATCVAATYPDLKRLLKAVTDACDGKMPTLDGVSEVTILIDGGGPDFTDGSSSRFAGSRDFHVSYNEVRQ